MIRATAEADVLSIVEGDAENIKEDQLGVISKKGFGSRRRSASTVCLENW